MTPMLFLIIFVGVAFASGVVLCAIWRMQSERAEEAVKDSMGQITPLRRFVSPERFLALRFSFCFFSATGIASIFIFNGITNPFGFLPVAVAAGVAGWKIPGIFYGIKIRQRKAAFDSQILQLTMILANGLRSGQALPQALTAVSQRMPPPMKEEVVTVLRETTLGIDLPDALERLYARMPGEDLRLLVTSVRLTLQAGGSLADVLERMVEMIRGRTEFQEKLKTMTAQGRFQAIAMSLAPLAVYIILRLIDPPLMKPLTSTFAGWMTIGGVALWVGIGFFIINKIVTIEV